MRSPETLAALAALDPRERRIVEAYTDPESPTYANGRASVRLADPRVSVKTAGQTAWRMKQSARIQRALTAVLDDAGAGREQRAITLASMLHQEYSTENTVDYLDADGTLQRTLKSRTQVKPEARVRIIDTLNKMDGLYQEQRVAGDLARETYYRELDALVGPPIKARKRRKPVTSVQPNTRTDNDSSEGQKVALRARKVGQGRTRAPKVVSTSVVEPADTAVDAQQTAADLPPDVSTDMNMSTEVDTSTPPQTSRRGGGVGGSGSPVT